MADILTLWDVQETQINEGEKTRLAECEAVIERGLKTFVDVGNALLEIRDNRLYRQDYDTFEDYCRDRWNMQRAYAYRLIGAAEVVANLSPIGDKLPTTETQARPLTSLPPDEQIRVWQQAVDTAPASGITALHIQSVVNQFKQDTAPAYQPATRPENIHVSDDSYEWYTPVEYIDAARAVMGSIDLDPASCEEAQAVVRAGSYYTIEDDGLRQDWFGNVWINPPYCMPEIDLFVTKVIEEYNSGGIFGAVVLTNNATDTGWFHRLLNAAGIACFTKGRVKFWGPDGSQAAGARQGQTIFYLGGEPDKFKEIFSAFGIVVRVE